MGETQPRKVIARECRFAVYCPGESSNPEDLHMVKEVVHYDDNTSQPSLKFIKNYKRPFYVTKTGMRNHKEFKEWEKLEHLNRFECKQRDLTFAVAKALGKPYFRGTLRDLCTQEPYVYGADITSTAIIKHEYSQRWSKITPYSYAAFDTETDMIHGHGKIMMATISFKDKVYTSVVKEFVKDVHRPVDKTLELCHTYLAEEIDKRKIKFEIEIVEDEMEAVNRCIAKAHEWKPDWLAVWNIEFDLDKIHEAANRAKVDLKDLMCDPSVPPEYRHYKFKKGPAKKVTASGRVMNFKPSQRWHSVTAPASFTWIDAMQVYRQVRTGSPEEQSYSLDAILAKHKLKGKLKFKELEGIQAPEDGAAWHRFMQSKFPLHYIVYNIFDCIAMELLDEKTFDLQLSMPMFAGCTDFANFNSLPKKVMNELHWDAQKRKNVVPGTTGSDMTTEVDDEFDLTGWIVALPSHTVEDNGLRIIAENPNLSSNIRVGVADLDVAGAYPTNTEVFNVSKETTKCELLNIEGIDEYDVRMQTIGFSAGFVNASEFVQTLHGCPDFHTLLEEYDRQTAT